MLTNYLKGKGRADADGSVSRDEAQKLCAAIEERDETIARLEQALGEQEARIEELQAELEQASFKAETLERSYSTQLGKARERADLAEQSIGSQKTRIEELEAGHAALSRELAGVRARLEPFGPDPASIDELLESSSSPQAQSRIYDPEDTVASAVDLETPEEMLSPDDMFTGKGE